MRPAWLPRLRWRVRWLMLAVAAVAVSLGVVLAVERRKQEFLRLARYHQAAQRALMSEAFGWGRAVPMTRDEARRVVRAPGTPGHDAYKASWYHADLWIKYQRAAGMPLFLVSPDPPPPPRANPALPESGTP